jgi:hypothetical protein
LLRHQGGGEAEGQRQQPGRPGRRRAQEAAGEQAVDDVGVDLDARRHRREGRGAQVGEPRRLGRDEDDLVAEGVRRQRRFAAGGAQVLGGEHQFVGEVAIVGLEGFAAARGALQDAALEADPGAVVGGQRQHAVAECQTIRGAPERGQRQAPDVGGNGQPKAWVGRLPVGLPQQRREAAVGAVGVGQGVDVADAARGPRQFGEGQEGLAAHGGLAAGGHRHGRRHGGGRTLRAGRRGREDGSLEDVAGPGDGGDELAVAEAGLQGLDAPRQFAAHLGQVGTAGQGGEPLPFGGVHFAPRRRLGEEQVEADGGGAVGGQVFGDLAVQGARPGPAAVERGQAFDGLLGDVEDDDAFGVGGRRGVLAGAGVEGAALEVLQLAAGVEADRRGRQQRQPERQPHRRQSAFSLPLPPTSWQAWQKSKTVPLFSSTGAEGWALAGTGLPASTATYSPLGTASFLPSGEVTSMLPAQVQAQTAFSPSPKTIEKAVPRTPAMAIGVLMAARRRPAARSASTARRGSSSW